MLLKEKTIVTILSACLLNVAIAENATPVVAKGELVAGKRLDEYANQWWQWANAMSDEESAVVDTTGEKCGTNQDGDVWFLAGGYGSAKIQRTCAVPHNKYLFFPVINMAEWPDSDDNMTCEAAKTGAAINDAHLQSIAVELDGKKVDYYRLKSQDCFDLYALVPKAYDAPKVYPAATDGYWVMLKPLSEGKHHLKFKAHYADASDEDSEMIQDIEYQLEVAKP